MAGPLIHCPFVKCQLKDRRERTEIISRVTLWNMTALL